MFFEPLDERGESLRECGSIVRGKFERDSKVEGKRDEVERAFETRKIIARMDPDSLDLRHALHNPSITHVRLVSSLYLELASGREQKLIHRE